MSRGLLVLTLFSCACGGHKPAKPPERPREAHVVAPPPALVFQTLQFGAQWAPIERIRYELRLDGGRATVTATRERRPHIFKGVVVGGGEPTKWTRTDNVTYTAKTSQRGTELWLEFEDENASTYSCKDDVEEIAFDADVDVMAGDAKADCSTPIAPFPKIATHAQHVLRCRLQTSKGGVGIEFPLTQKPGGWLVFANPPIEYVMPLDSCVAETSGYRRVQ